LIAEGNVLLPFLFFTDFSVFLIKIAIICDYPAFNCYFYVNFDHLVYFFMLMGNVLQSRRCASVF